MNSDGWIRSRGQSIVLRVAAWFEMGIFAIAAAAVLTGPESPEPVSPQDRLLGRIALIVFGVLAAAMGYVGLRFASAGARPEHAGLRVRNVFTQRVIPWADIEGFSLGRYSLSPYMGRVHLRGGAIWPIWGIAAPNIWPDNPRTAKLIAQLNDELPKHSLPTRPD